MPLDPPARKTDQASKTTKEPGSDAGLFYCRLRWAMLSDLHDDIPAPHCASAVR